MTEVLVQFEPLLTDAAGLTYVVRICGREAEDGLWDGWIEFDPQHGGTLRTPRETRQPNRTDLEYWASGITVSYLEGALTRARDSVTPEPRHGSAAASAAFEGPASPQSGAVGSAEPGERRPRSILDPFAVHAQGEDVLREELSALDEGHLRNIIQAYALIDEEELDLLAVQRSTLAEMIVAAVRKQAG